jgi:hypothetical protein
MACAVQAYAAAKSARTRNGYFQKTTAGCLTPEVPVANPNPQVGFLSVKLTCYDGACELLACTHRFRTAAGQLTGRVEPAKAAVTKTHNSGIRSV